MVHGKINLSPIQKTTIFIIILATIAVISFAIFAATHHHRTIDVKSEISALSTQYYEEYFFPNLEKSIQSHSDSSISDVLSPYVSSGFSRVPLRQIIARTQSDQYIIDYISAYCDVNKTFVHFFPEEPFSTTSYRTSYTYSCNF